MKTAHIKISLARQVLDLFEGATLMQTYPVSTARNGAGEQEGSFCTPRGRHRIRVKIGAGAAPGTVFIGRRPTGEIYSPELAASSTRTDWILTRILWLCGEEPGLNRLGRVDTMRRYIYIHGAPDSVELGKPDSIGCIRMRNRDIIALFDAVSVGARVLIEEQSA